MTFVEKKMTLMDALLEQRGIQHIVDTAMQLLGNPLFIEDTELEPFCSGVAKTGVPNMHTVFVLQNENAERTKNTTVDPNKV